MAIKWKIIDEDDDQITQESELFSEMATIGYPVIENTMYKIVIRGPDNNDRDQPHVHIYLKSDERPGTKFNFEVSLFDILTKDEINLVKQYDSTRNNRKVDIKNRADCSWEGYTWLKDGFIEFINEPPNGKFKLNNPTARTNLELIINKWNDESNDTSYNPLAEVIKDKKLEVLDKYKIYFPSLYPPTPPKKKVVRNHHARKH